MTTHVKEILEEKGREVVSVKPDSSIYDAVLAMVDHHIGAVLVIAEDSKLVGIFTERDVLNQCVLRCEELKGTRVDSVMTTDLIIGFLDDDVDYLMGIMTSNKIRHLPILEDERVSGVISIGDLVKSRLEKTEFENHYLKDYIMGKYPG